MEIRRMLALSSTSTATYMVRTTTTASIIYGNGLSVNSVGIPAGAENYIHAFERAERWRISSEE